MNRAVETRGRSGAARGLQKERCVRAEGLQSRRENHSPFWVEVKLRANEFRLERSASPLLLTVPPHFLGSFPFLSKGFFGAILGLRDCVFDPLIFALFSHVNRVQTTMDLESALNDEEAGS
jgi:hypothetical protein